GHSGRAVAARVTRAPLAGSRSKPPHGDARSAPRGTVRQNVGRGADANGGTATERAGVRQEECGDIHNPSSDDGGRVAVIREVGGKGIRISGVAGKATEAERRAR